MEEPARVDIVHSSPVIAHGLADAVRRHGGTVERPDYSWVQFVTQWDFTAGTAVIDAYLDDHVPLALKVRALRKIGSEVVVLGLLDERLRKRADREGARLWLEPSLGLDGTAAQIMSIAGGSHARMLPPPVSGDVTLTDREVQILASYASRRAPSAAKLSHHLGISLETTRAHLRTGRRKYAVAGRDVSSRARLQRALVDDGYLVDELVWERLGRW